MRENVAYHKSLESLASSFNLSHSTHQSVSDPSSLPTDTQMLFLLSVSGALKQSLLDSADLLLYTPLNEHFGIVPLEAMLNRVPVLAADQGGPRETVVDGSTGWLRPTEEVEKWTQIMAEVVGMAKHVAGRQELSEMGFRGEKRVREEFSKEKMAWRMELEIDSLKSVKREPIVPVWIVASIGFTIFAAIGGYVLTNVLFRFIALDVELERHLNETRAKAEAEGKPLLPW